MINQIKISIVVPAYNAALRIEETVRSILAQTHSNMEIIIVNDGSVDQTKEIIDHLVAVDSRIIPVHKENGGVTSARLAGIERATGEYIGFVDSDDYVEPDMFELLLNNALEYDAEISHCGYQMVFPSGRVKYYYNSGRIIEENKPVIELLKGNYIEPGLWNKLFDRKLFQCFFKENLMDQSIKINEDLLMNYYLFRQAKRAVFRDVCKYHYMVHDGSAATSKVNQYHLMDPIKVSKIIIKDTIGNNELFSIANARLVNQLIALATKPLKENPKLIKLHRKKARRELRKMLWKVLFGRYGFSLKVKALWASVWPASYMWVHELYLRKTGLDKIYSLED